MKRLILLESSHFSPKQTFLWAVAIMIILIYQGNVSKSKAKWIVGPLSLMVQAFFLWVCTRRFLIEGGIHSTLDDDKVAYFQSETQYVRERSLWSCIAHSHTPPLVVQFHSQAGLCSFLVVLLSLPDTTISTALSLMASTEVGKFIVFFSVYSLSSSCLSSND